MPGCDYDLILGAPDMKSLGLDVPEAFRKAIEAGILLDEEEEEIDAEEFLEFGAEKWSLRAYA